MNSAPTLSPPHPHAQTVIAATDKAPAAPNRGARPTGESRRWPGIAAKAAVIVVLGVAAVVFRNPLLAVFKQPAPTPATPRDELVRLTDSRNISVGDSPLAERLRAGVVQPEKRTLRIPVMNVTGSIIARLAAGADAPESRWDFATADIANAYGDWIKAKADVAFYQKQVDKVKELVKDRIDNFTAEFERAEKGLAAGTSSKKEVAQARFDKTQAEFQGQKDIHEAETALKNAVRNRGLLERQLLQAGVDPDVLVKAKDGLVLVVADVPEAKIALLSELVDMKDMSKNKRCTAKFFSYPDQPCEGRVGRVGPSLAKDKRTLRVTFELDEHGVFDDYRKKGQLLPGMFADIGLGTEEREILTVPADALLHVGEHDYVLVEAKPGEYAARPVSVGEPLALPSLAGSPSAPIIVLSGLATGDRVVASGAILLKPSLVKSLNGNGHH